MNKKLFIIFTLFLLPAQWVFSQSDPLKKVTFLPMWVPQCQFAGYYMAKEKGFYAQHGLDVTILSGGYGSDASAEFKDVLNYLKKEKADFGIMPLSTAIKDHVANPELVNIGQIFQSSEIMYVAKKKSGIKSLADFEGKKIAVWRNVLNEQTMGFLTKNNIQAKVIPMDGGINLLLKDAVEICAVMHHNEYNRLINHGLDPDELSVFSFKDYGMNFPQDGIYCMEQTINKDPEMCRNFVDASIEGWNYALSNPEESIKVLEKIQKRDNVQFNKTLSTWMLKCMEEVIHPPGVATAPGNLLESDYTNTVEFLLENKIINDRPDYQIFFRGRN